MSTEDLQREQVELLREIRDRQREAVEVLKQQRAMVEEQLKRSKESVEESIGLQKLALRRARSASWIALPGIAVCIAAIAYLVIRYF